MTHSQKLAQFSPVELEEMHRKLRGGKIAGTWGNLFPTHPSGELSGGSQQEALGVPTVDDRTDQDWVNPWAQKGTESITAGVEIHETPRVLPPRDADRRHIDEDEQEVLKDEGKVGGFKSALLRKKQ